MKKIIYLIGIITLFSCEKYEEISNPQLNLNGRWDVVQVDVVIDNVNYDSEVIVLDDDRATVGTFYVTCVDNDGNLLLSQDF